MSRKKYLALALFIAALAQWAKDLLNQQGRVVQFHKALPFGLIHCL